MTSARSWVIVLGLALGVCVSNGFARFAYGLILPAMRDDLSWSYAQAGWINTANAFGYIFGAMVAFALIQKLSPSWMFSVGLIGTSVFLLLSGLTQDFWMLTLWRILAGATGAPVFITGGALVAAMFPTNAPKNALAIAVYFGGGGLGLILSGAALPALFEYQGVSAWPLSWIALGIASLVACPLSIWAAVHVQVPSSQAQRPMSLPARDMLGALIGYGFFATGYIVYLTFIVAWMKALPADFILVSLVWVTIGMGIIASPFVWRSILAKSASGFPLAFATATVALGTMLPVFWTESVGLFVSACLFGLAVFIGPGAVTNFSRKNLPQASWGKSVSLFTLVFAIGQTTGPAGAGWIIDYTGQIQHSLLFAGGALTVGALAALSQKPLVQPQ
ncbi:MAG: YbfB/YjiJ family MFS transporter [Sulfitobacter sp.]